MAKMKEGECRCTTKNMQYCKTEGKVRIKAKCPPQKVSSQSLTLKEE